MDLDIMRAIQSMANGFWDFVFQAITLLGSSIFAIAVVCVFYWCVDKKRGEGVIFNLFLSFSVNNVLKDIIRRPRPIGQPGIVTDPSAEAGVTVEGGSYPYSWSFPSGHAQVTATLLGSLCIWFRKWWLTLLSAVVLILVMLSRVYLGVHYPSDVLAGALLGIGFAFLGTFVYLKCYDRRHLLYFLCAGLLLFSFFFASPDTAKSVGGFVGFALGTLLEDKFVKFATDGPVWKRILRLAVGVVALGGCYYLFKAVFPDGNLFSALRYAVLLLLATFVYPLIFTKLGF